MPGSPIVSCRCRFLIVALVVLGGCAETKTPPPAGAPQSAAPTSPSTDPPAPPAAASPETSPPATGSASASLPTSGDWPCWRGPQGDGISRATDWTAHWPEDGPPVLWQKNLGTGFSAFAVVGSRLFGMGNVDGRDVVWCLDAATGEEHWTHRYVCDLVANLHDGGPGATPTVDGDRVYTLGREGQLYCLAADTGREIWRALLPDLTGVEMPEWGFTCSPVVLGQKVILDAGRTIALDKQTGAKIWETEPFRPGYGTPAVFPRDGQTLLAVLNNDCLLVLDSDNGREIARHPWHTDFATSSSTPIVRGDEIFLSTGYTTGCGLLRLVGDKLELVYENKNMRNHFNNSVLYQGSLYGPDGNSHASRLVKITCLDWKTGEVHWAERGFGCGSVLVADGKLIVLSDDGRLATAAATPESFTQISAAKVLDGLCWTVPVLAHGRLYVRNSAGDTVCLDVSPRGE